MMVRPSGYVNLDRWAQEWLPQEYPNSPQKNPLRKPEISDRMVTDFHSLFGLTWSYGGWLENRRYMHRDTYLEKKRWWMHLGIDVNAPAGTTICALANGQVMYIGDDTPLVGGWGGHIIQRILFRGTTHLLIYAHLGEITCHVGMELKKGRGIASIGTPAENGNWFPHLHLQLFAHAEHLAWRHGWQAFSDAIDGYGPQSSIQFHARHYPDPTPLIFGFG